MASKKLEEKLCTKDNKLSHHAYCILGNTEKLVDDLQKFLKKETNFICENNPDFWYGEYDTMDIEDSRALNELHQNRPVASDKKIFVINTNFITEKAQNSMLKIFEEPRGDTHFFIVMPSADNIISTLKSRIIFIDERVSETSSLINVKEFLSNNIGVRFETIKQLIESISDEEESKIEVIKFINSLELELKKKIKISDRKDEEIKVFEEIEKVRIYAGEQSPSLKMLLEHLAILMPILKD